MLSEIEAIKIDSTCFLQQLSSRVTMRLVILFWCTKHPLRHSLSKSRYSFALTALVVNLFSTWYYHTNSANFEKKERIDYEALCICLPLYSLSHSFIHSKHIACRPSMWVCNKMSLWDVWQSFSSMVGHSIFDIRPRICWDWFDWLIVAVVANISPEDPALVVIQAIWSENFNLRQLCANRVRLRGESLIWTWHVNLFDWREWCIHTLHVSFKNLYLLMITAATESLSVNWYSKVSCVYLLGSQIWRRPTVLNNVGWEKLDLSSSLILVVVVVPR